MRAYTILLCLFAFGLMCSAVDSLGIADEKVDFIPVQSDTALIQEISSFQEEVVEEQSWLIYVPKITWLSIKMLAKALLYSITIIPLLAKWGVSLDLMAIIQAMQTLSTVMALAAYARGISTKNVE